MKTRILSLVVGLMMSSALFCSNLSLNGMAQSFAPVGSEWYYGYTVHFFGSVNQHDYYQLVSTGDTLIQGRVCNVIEQKRGFNLCRETPPKAYVTQRNDTVFLYVPQMAKFTPFYLFGANKGDSWTISHPAGDVKVVVDSVSMTTIGGSEVKQQFVTYHYDWQNYDFTDKSSIISGIGDVNYLFNYVIHALPVCDDYKANEGLRCYTNPNFGTHKWTDLPCDTVFEELTSNNTYLTNGDSWNELKRSSELYGSPIIRNHSIVGDTIIGNTKYKAVYVTSDSLYLPQKAQFGCGIREDKGKWYFRFGADSEEVLYYDFGMKVGDSLTVDYGPTMKAVYYVLKIDTVEMNGQSRKRFDIGFKSGNSFYLHTHWIEGVGCDDGLIPTDPFITMSGYVLLCYHHNGELVYINPKYNSCSLTSGIQIASVSKILSVCKIPESEGLFSVKSDVDINELAISDMRGAVVLQKAPYDTKTTISLKNAPKGVYILRVKTEKGVLARKIVNQ